jgi:hypothetical protein
LSYNQPKFSATASWSSNAITLTEESIIEAQPYSIFINTENTMYMCSWFKRQILVWPEGSVKVTRSIPGGTSSPYSLFVTTDDDVYFEDGDTNRRVLKWSMNTNSSTPVMYVGESCYGLFVDINDTLYCSISKLSQVVGKSMSSDSSTLNIVAGTGCSGYQSYALNDPKGIFVDTDFGLYVADCGNSRIHRRQ